MTPLLGFELLSQAPMEHAPKTGTPSPLVGEGWGEGCLRAKQNDG